MSETEWAEQFAGAIKRGWEAVSKLQATGMMLRWTEPEDIAGRIEMILCIHRDVRETLKEVDEVLKAALPYLR